jgi:hypothetical protein
MLIQYSLNKIITDKIQVFNTNNIPGILVIFGEFIIFQPNNLHNKISMFDRVHPLHYKHNTINFHFPTNFSKTSKIDIINKNYKDILQQIYTNFEIVFNTQLTKSPSEYITLIKNAYTNNDWNYLANRIIHHLIKLDFDINILKKIVIHHYIDFLSIHDKLILINYVYTYINTDSSFPKEFISLIFDYFHSNSFSFPYNDLDYKAIFFQDINNSITLYILKDNTWNIATPSEISFYREKLSYHILDLINAISNSKNNFIGFIDFNPKNIIFKFLNTSTKKDRGFRCDQANIKKIYEVLDELTSTLKIDINFLKNKDINKDKLKINDICVSSELLMRYSQYNKLNNNIWFINTFSHLTIQSFLKNIK